MSSSKATLAIYGIQDIEESDFPNLSHDHAVCLMQNGKVEQFFQLERISRKKRDNQLPQALFPILKKSKLLDAQRFDLVFVDNVVGRSFISSNGKIRFEAPLSTQLATKPEIGKSWWINQAHPAYAVNHELAHIFSCLPFYGSFRENSLLIHFDGGASLSNFSAWTWKKNQLHLVESHWDLEPVSKLFNANALSFALVKGDYKDRNSVPGKLMGFAAYGTYNPELLKWLEKHNFFENIWGNKKIFFEQAAKDFGYKKKSIDLHDSFIQDIAACIQHTFSETVLHKLEQLQALSGAKHLYYSGGSALNIVTNRLIGQSNLFDSIHIPPCPDDSGLALGAAAYVEQLKHGKVELHSPYLNNAFLDPSPLKDSLQEVAALIAKGEVVAICNGFGEVGPRALGNRSLIARADDKELAKKVSMQYKKREWYRPIAPIIREENLQFFSDDHQKGTLSHYMLTEFHIREAAYPYMKGTVHINNTARIQTVNFSQNAYIYQLLELLEKDYDIKALINTSFNYSGEPIVHTEEDAVRSAQTMGIPYLVINGALRKL